jgi:isopentenyl-diphosphate delta-isomerase
MKEKVILVDKNDKEVGIGEKMETHLTGKLHRAFSIFIFNSQGELLLQKRAKTKYHSGGLWTNTCCSHPRPGELTEKAAHRRLQEEMGFDCQLKKFPALLIK